MTGKKFEMEPINSSEMCSKDMANKSKTINFVL